MRNCLLAFLIFLLPVFSGPASAREVYVFPELETYGELVEAIRAEQAGMPLPVERMAGREQVLAAWKIGKLIEAHVLQYKERATNGEEVAMRLGSDLAMSDRELYIMLQFAHAYPAAPPEASLSWAHFQQMLVLKPAERDALTAEAERENWSVDQLRAEILRRSAPVKRTRRKKEIIGGPVLTAQPGTPYTYRIIRAISGPLKGELVLDLGFGNYHRPLKKMDKKLAEGDVVQSLVEDKKAALGQSPQRYRQHPEYKLTKAEVGPEEMYTYNAHVIEVMSGDTFTAIVDLGFNFLTVQKLRLRPVEPPAAGSSGSREAGEFLRLLLQGGSVVIRTYQADQNGRYLADVFAHGEYINQKMVERGFAAVLEAAPARAKR